MVSLSIDDAQVKPLAQRLYGAALGAIMKHLSDHGSGTISELAEISGVSRPTVQRALAELAQLGLVAESAQRPATSGRPARAWAAGEMPMMQARAAGGHAMGAARPLAGAARFAAYAAGQAACVGHVAEHDLGAAAYAIKAVRSACPDDPDAGRTERDWQRDRLPDAVRALVLDDQARRDHLCWSVFSD